ncbi:MAG: Hpt domain-containing protein [Clostridia bacterium]
MNELDLSKLRYSGVDVDGSMERFSGNSALYEKFLKKFVNDDTFLKMVEFMRVKNFEEAYKGAHSLKGVTGNLGLTDLYNSCDAMCRAFKEGALEKIIECYGDAKKHYDMAIEIIKGL